MKRQGIITWSGILIYLLMLVPSAGSAQSTLDKLRQGASNAVSTVGDAASKAGSALDQTVDRTKESLLDEDTPEATRAKLDEMADATLARLFEEHPESQSLFDSSAGYAVFDAREASFYVAAGYGRGVAVDRASQARTYMKMATGGAGLSFGFGDFERQLVILMESDAVLREFVNQGFDASASVSSLTGDDHEELAAQFTDGKAMFMLTRRGWKVAAKLTGTRYWPDEDLNAN